MRLFLVVLLATAVALSGCGGDDDPESSTGANAGATETATAPSGSTETTPAETTETEADQQAGDDDTAAGGGGSDDAGGGSDDSGGTSASGGGSGSGGGGSSGGGGGSSGSSADQQAVSTTVTDFYTALSSGNGDKACALMDEAVKAQFTKALAQAQNKQGASCETLAGSIADAYPEQLRQRLGDLRVVKVTIQGDNATVTAKIPDTPSSTLPLVRDGDSWKIQAPVGAGATP